MSRPRSAAPAGPGGQSLVVVALSLLLVTSLTSATWFFRFTPITGSVLAGGRQSTYYVIEPDPNVKPPAPEKSAVLAWEGELMPCAIGLDVVGDWGVAIGLELLDVCYVGSAFGSSVTWVGPFRPAFYFVKGIGPGYENEGPVFTLSGRAGIGLSEPLIGGRLNGTACYETGSEWLKYGVMLSCDGIWASMPPDLAQSTYSRIGKQTFVLGLGAFVRAGGWRRIR